MSEQIKHNIINKIQNLYEVDIGDFKRQVITMLNRWEEELSNDLEPSPILKDLFQQVKTSIICNNTTEIETLREQIINQLYSSGIIFP
ncbi:MAG: hypothetical protein OXM55_00840 [Bdellovibrionales bacterium]|nr:hypothetical protein [Bdellovibrionales bacterium]